MYFSVNLTYNDGPDLYVFPSYNLTPGAILIEFIFIIKK